MESSRLLMLAATLAFAPLNAQELLFLGGGARESGLEQTTYTWGVEYHGLGDYTSLSLGWLNEGHLQGHHRDGPVAQLWAHTDLLPRRLALELGLGPYTYFDTQLAAEGASYANDHGYGLIYSAGLKWDFKNRWLLHLRINRVVTDTPVDTTQLLVGIGYQLDTPSANGSRWDTTEARQNTTRNEFTVFAGRTILNSFKSENSTALSLEYRRVLGPYMEGSLALLHEGGQHIIRRNGVTTQLWMVRAFLHDRLVLGAGAGAYFVLNKEHLIEYNNDKDEQTSGIISLTASYRYNARWFARLSLNRIATGYSRDTDIILLGGGYRF